MQTLTMNVMEYLCLIISLHFLWCIKQNKDDVSNKIRIMTMNFTTFDWTTKENELQKSLFVVRRVFKVRCFIIVKGCYVLV